MDNHEEVLKVIAERCPYAIDYKSPTEWFNRVEKLNKKYIDKSRNIQASGDILAQIPLIVLDIFGAETIKDFLHPNKGKQTENKSCIDETNNKIDVETKKVFSFSRLEDELFTLCNDAAKNKNLDDIELQIKLRKRFLGEIIISNI